jgi:hypothetical protein
MVGTSSSFGVYPKRLAANLGRPKRIGLPKIDKGDH